MAFRITSQSIKSNSFDQNKKKKMLIIDNKRKQIKRKYNYSAPFRGQNEYFKGRTW